MYFRSASVRQMNKNSTTKIPLYSSYALKKLHAFTVTWGDR